MHWEVLPAACPRTGVTCIQPVDERDFETHSYGEGSVGNGRDTTNGESADELDNDQPQADSGTTNGRAAQTPQHRVRLAQQETRRRYLNYAMSVITSRALPDVRDGLKPVQRRILYTMYHDLHLTSDGRPRKCAKIVGDVTGNYHPHGDDGGLRRAGPHGPGLGHARIRWSTGRGNFGSVDGDPPAAAPLHRSQADGRSPSS